jgi:hypothetical protein
MARSSGAICWKIVEERYGRGATLITSQIPVERWHA